MKTIVTILALGALLVMAAPAFAADILNETFTYANGALVPNGGWATFSGSGTDIQVVGGKILGINTNAPDDAKTFAARDTFNCTYACFQVTIPTPATTPVVNGYFAMFKDAGTSNFVSRLFVLPVTGQPTKFTFGISLSSVSTTILPTPWPTALNFDTPYWIVISYCPATKVATLWVNPVNAASPSVTMGTAAVMTKLNVSSFAFRQSATGSPNTGSVSWSFLVDNLGVGSSFNDACIYSGITPAAGSTWGQIKRTYR
jgi:hypothetical protein